MLSGENYSSNLIRKTSLYISVSACVGSSLMYIFGDQAIELSLLAAFNCLLVISAAIFIHRFPDAKCNGLLLITSCVIAVLLCTSVSGGISSRFIVIISTFPIMMCLMLKRCQAVAFVLLIALYVTVLSVFGDYFPDYTGVSLLETERFPKTLWLLLALVTQLLLGLVFVKIIYKLTIRLESPTSASATTGIYDEESVIAYADKVLLKLRADEKPSGLMTLMVIEPTLLCAQDSAVQQQTLINGMAGCIKKVMRKDFKIIGQTSLGQLIVCIEVNSRDKAKAIAQCCLEAFTKKLKHSDEYIGTNIGLISVDGDVNIDVKSLFSLSMLALAKSKKKGSETIIDYYDLRKP
ncbi:MAG: hypothetical protein ACJAVV_003766 [Alphaproteobacteria bacterium]